MRGVEDALLSERRRASGRDRTASVGSLVRGHVDALGVGLGPAHACPLDGELDVELAKLAGPTVSLALCRQRSISDRREEGKKARTHASTHFPHCLPSFLIASQKVRFSARPMTCTESADVGLIVYE